MVRSTRQCPRRFVGFACLVLLCMAAGRTAADDLTPRPTMGEIIRLDAGADALLPANATIEVLAAGLDWSEGPVWLPKADAQPRGGGFVVFSDVPRNKVYQWKEGAGLSVFLEPSGYTGLPGYSSEQGSNGLAINAAGELISCEHGDRRVSVLTRRGGKRTLADTIDGSGGYYKGHAEPASRSLMNVTFRLPSEELEKKFVTESAAAAVDGEAAPWQQAVQHVEVLVAQRVDHRGRHRALRPALQRQVRLAGVGA